jgi:hypothetical protein
VVVVDRATWALLPFNTKLAFVQTVACAVVKGDPAKTVPVRVLDNIDNHDIGDYDGAHLTIP